MFGGCNLDLRPPVGSVSGLEDRAGDGSGAMSRA